MISRAREMKSILSQIHIYDSVFQRRINKVIMDITQFHLILFFWIENDNEKQKS